MRSYRRFHRSLLPAWFLVYFLTLAFTLVACQLQAAEKAATVEERLFAAAEYLASDELEGRGIGTAGLEQAAEYIREQFLAAGLKVDAAGGDAFQGFTMTTGAELGKNNELSFSGPPAKNGEKEQVVKLKVGEDYNPFAIGGSGRFRLPLVFAGYGITGRKENYDDYADIDVQGKAVVVLRHEPQQDNPHSAFDGKEHSRHAWFTTKASNAFQHGAAAVIFVTDATEIHQRVDAAKRRWEKAIEQLGEARREWAEVESPTRAALEEHRQKIDKLAAQIQAFGRAMAGEYDRVLPFAGAGRDNQGREMPVVHVKREVIDRILRAAGKDDLATLEKKIDEGPAPQSFEIDAWQVAGQTDIRREQSEVKNVIGVLEGSGPNADETIIIGAHYDHLGRGGPGSAAPGNKEIHNGADDNASGTAVLIEVARRLASREAPLPRRVVFIAFTAEERGLLGSAHYANEPLFPLEKTVAMLNMDMVGRLQNNKLIADGVGTAEEFTAWVDELNAALDEPFELVKKPGGFGPSDHATFYAKQIPVIHFFTGSHKDYHKPSDDVDKLNVPGMRRAAELVAATAAKIATAEKRPTYQQTKQAVARRGGTRPYLGSIPEFRSDAKGYALAGVAKDGPAERAGIRGGDVIIKFGDSKIANLEDIDGALRKYKAGEKVPVVVLREGKELTLEVILDPPQ